jgi:hypothetical protein
MSQKMVTFDLKEEPVSAGEGKNQTAYCIDSEFKNDCFTNGVVKQLPNFKAKKLPQWYAAISGNKVQ